MQNGWSNRIWKMPLLFVIYDMKWFWYLNEYIAQWIVTTTSRRLCNQFYANNSHSQIASGSIFQDWGFRSYYRKNKFTLFHSLILEIGELIYDCIYGNSFTKCKWESFSIEYGSKYGPYKCNIDLLKRMLFVNRMHKRIQMNKMTNDPLNYSEELFDFVQGPYFYVKHFKRNRTRSILLFRTHFEEKDKASIRYPMGILYKRINFTLAEFNISQRFPMKT